MATLLELHTGIATRLKTISGLSVYDYPPQAPHPPVAWVELTRWEPEAMGRRGLKTYTFDVIVLTAQTLRPQDGYRPLMEFASADGAKSIDLAIWDGNAAHEFAGLPETNAFVESFTVLGSERMNEFEMYGGTFTVQVRTKGA